MAYCDVTGRESRLPLRLKGEGLGPKLRFSFDSLDIQNIFVNSAHAYEVDMIYVHVIVHVCPYRLHAVIRYILIHVVVTFLIHCVGNIGEPR